MKHFIGLSTILFVGAAVVIIGLWYQEEERKQRVFEVSNTVRDSVARVPNTQNLPKEQDAFGLFAGDRMRYSVEFEVVWSASQHGKYYPRNAHFSPPVLWSGDGRTVFALGEQASSGIEEMAETGLVRTLKQELEKLLVVGSIREYKVGQRVDAPGTDNMTIEFDRERPVFSLVSMIAPSPDWFVAVAGVNVLEDGRWKRELSINTVALDAGTEEGEEFSITNQATSPRQSVGELVDIPAGTLPTFVRVHLKQIGYGE